MASNRTSSLGSPQLVKTVAEFVSKASRIKITPDVRLRQYGLEFNEFPAKLAGISGQAIEFTNEQEIQKH